MACPAIVRFVFLCSLLLQVTIALGDDIATSDLDSLKLEDSQTGEWFTRPLVLRIWCLAVSLFSSQGLGDCSSWDVEVGGSETTAAQPPVDPPQRKLLESSGDTGDGRRSTRQGKMLLDGVGANGILQNNEAISSSGRITDAFVTSFSMILVTEIGDETFIIAALMAMRHSRTIVLAGALSALAIMTVLSTGLGVIVPNLISRKATNSAATVLYTFFGLRLLYIAWRANPHDTPQKELEEVEEKLEEADSKGNKGKSRSIKKILSRFLTPVFLEAFILTFLAEWGDRSQIATIALASHKNPIGVTIGATLGHVVCTSLAVVGGRLLALRISQRTVASVGGLLFLVFAVHSFYNPPL